MDRVTNMPMDEIMNISFEELASMFGPPPTPVSSSPSHPSQGSRGTRRAHTPSARRSRSGFRRYGGTGETRDMSTRSPGFFSSLFGRNRWRGASAPRPDSSLADPDNGDILVSALAAASMPDVSLHRRHPHEAALQDFLLDVLTGGRSHPGHHFGFLAEDESRWTYEQLLELDRNNVRRGLRAKELSRLECRKVEIGDPKMHCQICMSDSCPGESIMTLPCKHEYHQGCITKWLKGHRTCPVCRFEIPRK